MDQLRVLTVNVRGLKNKRKRKSVFSFLQKGNYDIVGRQECHVLTKEEKKSWELQWGGKVFYSLGTSQSWASSACWQETPA